MISGDGMSQGVLDKWLSKMKREAKAMKEERDIIDLMKGVKLFNDIEKLTKSNSLLRKKVDKLEKELSLSWLL